MQQQEQPSKLRIALTPEQQGQIQQVTGKAVAALEFTPEQLEERIAPGGKPALMGGAGAG